MSVIVSTDFRRYSVRLPRRFSFVTGPHTGRGCLRLPTITVDAVSHPARFGPGRAFDGNDARLVTIKMDIYGYQAARCCQLAAEEEAA
jgi:hypothetical protein